MTFKSKLLLFTAVLLTAIISLLLSNKFSIQQLESTHKVVNTISNIESN